MKPQISTNFCSRYVTLVLNETIIANNFHSEWNFGSLFLSQKKVSIVPNETVLEPNR